jgi:hypothetical protein
MEIIKCLQQREPSKLWLKKLAPTWFLETHKAREFISIPRLRQFCDCQLIGYYRTEVESQVLFPHLIAAVDVTLMHVFITAMVIAVNCSGGVSCVIQQLF